MNSCGRSGIGRDTLIIAKKYLGGPVKICDIEQALLI